MFLRALSWDLCFSQLTFHPLSNIIHGFEVSFHQYADDTSLFSILSSDSMSDQLRNLRKCTDAINDWHLVNFLQLNPQKSEIMFIGTPVRLKTMSPPTSINVAGTLLPSTTLKLLGVTFDSHLSFKEHSASIIKSCNHLIWSIHPISNTSFSAVIHLVFAHLPPFNYTNQFTNHPSSTEASRMPPLLSGMPYLPK